MESIVNGKKEEIKDKKEISFSADPGHYLIVISARVRGRQQISPVSTDDEDLTIQIDKKTFPKISDKDRLKDSPAAFSGDSLHGLLKTVYIVTALSGKRHSIVLTTDEPVKTATLESLEVFKLNLTDSLNININSQAEDGDRRPWITLALDNLSLKSLTATVTYSHRKQDSDDIKIIIDGQVKENVLKTIKHFLWHFAGSLLSKDISQTETEDFTLNLSQGLHYIEFWADRRPVLKDVKLSFGTVPLVPKRIPTVDDPEWTGDFSDDPDGILLARLIFGEAENQSKETKIWIAGSVLNRVKATAWPNTIHEIIRQTDQYDPFKPEDPNYPKVIDPLNGADEIRIAAWEQSYEVARGVLSGEIKNPTEATHFHGIGISKDRFIKQIIPDGRFIKKINDTYFYWSPN